MFSNWPLQRPWHRLVAAILAFAVAAAINHAFFAGLAVMLFLCLGFTRLGPCWIKANKKVDEAHLRENSNRYHTLFTNSIDAIVVILPDGRVTAANPAACALFGMTEEELCRAGGGHILDEAGPGALIAPTQSPDGRGTERETTLMRKDGTRFPALLKAALVDDSGHSCVILRDLTQRKTVEEELNRSETNFKKIFEHAPFGIYQTTLEGEFIRLNPRMAALFGFDSTQQMVQASSTITDFIVHAEQRNHVRQRALAAKEFIQGEIEYRRRDGTHFVGMIHMRAGHANGVTILEGFVEDISLRKQAQESLRKSELQFRQMTEGIDSVFWLASCSLDAVLYVSPAYERIWGRSCEEQYASPRLWMEAIHPEDLPQVQHSVEEMMHNRASEVEYRIERPDGTQRWIMDRRYPLPETHGDIPLFAGVASDITDRKVVEERLARYARRLIELEEDLRKGLAMDLHDGTGQELTALGFNLAYMANHLPGESGDKLSSTLVDSRTLLKDVTRRVRNLMAELHPFQLEKYGLPAAIQSYAEEYGRRSGVVVALHCDPKTPRLPLQKEIAMFRITQEAFNNTVKHAAATKIMISLGWDGASTRLSITDNGNGFVPQEPSLKPLESGWGLNIMRERAELVGGRFRLDTAVGVGTSITIEMTV